MRFAVVAAALAGAASAQQTWGGWPAANGTGVSYVTETVTAFTTFCPSATVITHGSATYTVTSATTLTITNCPCTITRPVTTSVYTSCSTSPVVKPTGTAPGYSSPAPSGTAPVTSPSTSPITPVGKGAADKLSVGVAGVLAVAGLVAAL